MFKFKNVKFIKDKFNVAISNGETFKTDNFSCEMRSNGGIKTYSQNLIYKINEDFIKENYSKLLLLEIIIPISKKSDL